MQCVFRLMNGDTQTLRLLNEVCGKNRIGIMRNFTDEKTSLK